MTLRELIYAARGDQRTMKQFAIDLGMSPAKLYKIAGGDIRKLPSDTDFHLIADKAVSESGVTYELLKDACEDVLREKSRSDKSLRNKTADILSFASHVVYQTALSSGAKVQAIDLNPRSQFSAEKAHGHFCDMGLAIENDSVTQKAYFAFKLSDETLNAENAERFIGQIFHAGYSSDEFYYLVFSEYRFSHKTKIESSEFLEDFSKVKLPVNMSIVYISRNSDELYQMNELSLGPEKGILLFNS